MKMRITIVMAVSLLLVAVGAWLFWQRDGRQATALRSNAAATNALAGKQNATNLAAAGSSSAMTTKFPTLNTNKLAYRLSNTTESLRTLQKMPHAVLLANAFLDTDKPLNLKIPAQLQSQGDPGAYIVQARGPINAGFRVLLANAGAQIVSYIPNNSYLVNAPANVAGALRTSALVQAVLPYEPYYKLQSSLLGLAVNQQPLPPGTALTLGLFGADAAAAEADVAKAGPVVIGRDQSPFGPVLRVLAPTDWTQLAQSKYVQFIEPMHTRRMANDLSRVTLGISLDTTSPITSGYGVNGYVLTGSNVMVAVNDTGVDTNHPDFWSGDNAQNPPGNPGGPQLSRVTGLSYFDMVDTNGHGTHVAGIIAGNGSMSSTVTNPAEGSVVGADYRGKAPASLLFSLNAGRFSDYQLQTNAAMVGALISNNSWDYGNGDAEYDLAAASYDAATRDALPFNTGSQPVLFVFAAGNDGSGNDGGSGGIGDTILSPGTAKNVITVGALEQVRYITNLVTTVVANFGQTGTNAYTTNMTANWQGETDSGNEVAAYSARGNVGIGTEGSNGRFKPDLVSPGSFVVSTSSQFNNQWNTNAYYNPTNVDETDYTFQLAATNGLIYYNVEVPPNAAGVNITIVPNAASPSPFPNLWIYARQSSYPTTAPGGYDILSTSNSLDIPPASGGSITGIGALQGNGFSFAVANTNGTAVNYDLVVDILETNDVGDLYSVLKGMNDSLGGYYRYESGTSMAAASVSGLLALVQDYFTNQFKPAMTPSPALMKALVINSARSVGDYGLAFANGINFEGWGLENISNCIPPAGLFNTPDNTTTNCVFFADESASNALATGESRTYIVNIDESGLAPFYQLQATLAWTDPPGNPAAAIKLVNNLDLIITNLDTGDVNYGSVYFGNDISPDIGYNLPWDTNTVPNLDTINNVQSIIVPALLAGQYSVTVVAHGVNVNAVTAQLNNPAGQYAPNIAQDYALVISVGEGEVTNAFTVQDGGFASEPTSDQNLTVVLSTNAPLMNQIVGANSPLMGTNTLPLGTNTVWGPNGVVTIGQTNQWHFYIVTNTGPTSDYTNAAFLTFQVDTLSIPRMGVVNPLGSDNATKPEADIDLYVSQDPSITNLNPVAISNCLAGIGTSRASIYNQGTQFAYLTNSSPGQVYYVGVQAEDQMASEYAFLPVFTDIPFSQMDKNGNEIVNGLMLPMPILTGNNKHPGVTNIFALAINPLVVGKVTVTNLIQHQNFGDLVGVLTFNQNHVVLNNHDGFGSTINKSTPIVYDDSRNAPLGTTNSDGPGSLTDYRGKSGLGPWILTELDNSAGGFTGQVSTLTLVIQPHRDLEQPGIVVTIPPGGWFVDYVDVPAGYTNLTFYATNVTTGLPNGTQPIQMYEKFGDEPTVLDYDQEATLTNGTPPGNSISVGPPLPLGQYYVGLYNPDTLQPQQVFIEAVLGISSSANDIFNYSSGASQSVPDDAVSGSLIQVPLTVTQLVSTVNVGLVINSPRISDYAFTLVSPTGQRVLLMENRGGGDTNGAGATFVYTNVLNSQASGGGAANTNYLSVNPNPTGTTVPITWNFYTVVDQMTVYSSTNPADFDPNGPYILYNTGFTNNQTIGPGPDDTAPVTVNVTVPARYTNITIIMNQFGNPFAVDGDAWTYTAGAPNTNYEYLEFTDDTNLATVPIKFAEPPFSFTEMSTNYTLSDLNLATNGDYLGLTNIHDAFGGWTVPTNVTQVSTIETNGQFVQVTNTVILTNNLVSVVTDPSTALGGDVGVSNYLALGSGTITRQIPTVPGRIYNVTFWYRGPNIVGWWRGEGNANDSSDPENNNNNGTLIGRFNFPAGEVGQAFEFGDQGNTYQFSGTNTYVQIPASTSLNVAAGGGFTVEGWINPTNLTRPQPVVEWLARVPTNMVDTNLAIIQGPVLNPANNQYYYLLSATNWQTSEKWAEEFGGHLATVETANEQNWIYDTFTAYGTENRDLWIGLGFTNSDGTFGWASGYPNLTYANWAPGQPLNCSGSDYFVAIMGPTNAYPGLWMLEDDLGRTCGNPPTNPIYGVVEVSTIPTNGVQFWISGTNGTPGQTNTLQGSLCANIVDTNYISHVIYSAPGLLTTNVYQHVVLTFNTNSGIAALYLNGTNVATSNLYTGGVSFVPKTDGDLLLGHDMSLYTNNFFGGEMDEMSVYRRTLSLAEISAIYHASADTTNRLIGKFDPSITPAVGLAEALVSFGGSSNVIYGVNNQWLMNSYTFTATTNSMPLTISGLEPGILLDAFAVSEAPATNLYYFPEQALQTLTGGAAAGNWTLQVWDSRVGAFVTNVDQLVSWQLSFVLQSNATISATLPPQTPVSSTVAPGATVYYSVLVPAWAQLATNLLVSSSEPISIYFNATNLPAADGTGPGDVTLLSAVTSGVSLPATVNQNPPYAGLQAGQIYYLGVQNTSAHAASLSLEVDYDMVFLTNGVPFTGDLRNPYYGSTRYFSYNVSSNAYEATFQLLQLSGNADLVVSEGAPLPQLNSTAYGSYNNSNADENIYVLTNSEPVPLSAGRWYVGVINRGSSPLRYSVLAKELDPTNGVITNGIMPAIFELTNGVPVNWTASPGAALTNFFHFHPTNAVVNGTNQYLQGLRFEVYNLTGNGDLTVQTNMLPLAPPFFQSSQNGGTAAELVFVFTNNVMTNLATDWYLGVPNREVTNINFTIVAQVLTNQYFPAFPEAQGAGAGANGGRMGDVYHVTTNLDSGLGSLRQGILTTTGNRTIVFDVSGTIALASPLLITNSNLTIAGETSPGGGITVAGQITSVQKAHDVVIRDIRFRPLALWAAQTNNFEGLNPGDFGVGNAVGHFMVTANQSSIVSDPATAFSGHTSFLALANGIISGNLPTVVGRTYTVAVTCRGPGMVAWWRGENNCLDSIGSNDGTLENGGPAYSTGEVGVDLKFDGVSDLVLVNASSALNVGSGGGFTADAWVNPNNITSSMVVYEYERALNTHNGSDVGVQFTLNNIPGIQYLNGAVGFNLVDTAGAGHSFGSGANAISAGGWSHVAMTYNKQSGQGAVYVNGQQVAQSYLGVFSPQTTFANLLIGGRTTFNSLSNPSDTFAGAMDELSFYNRALSTSELKAIYANGAAGKFDPAIYSSSPAKSLAEFVVTIAGQTNPILLCNNTNWQTQNLTFTATGASTPILVRGLEPGVLIDSISVLGNSDMAGALQFNSVSNMIADHISTAWSTNADMSVFASTNVTVQWSIMADSLLTTNGGGTNFVFGSVSRAGNGTLSFHHNLYADNYTGNPRLGDNLTLDFVDNVVYNWGLRSGLTDGTNDLNDNSPNGFTNQINYVCNYLIAGADTANDSVNNYNITNIAFFGGTTNALAATWIFQTNNFIDSDTNGVLNGSDTGWAMFTNNYTRFSHPFPTPPISVDEAYLAYEKVLDFAGVNMALRDPADTNIVTNVRTQAGRIIGIVPTTAPLDGQLPYLDTAGDGVPDFWKSTFTPAIAFYTPSNNNDRNGDGYTDLEEYNNWLADPHALTVTNAPVGVDLYQLCGGSGHLAFYVTNSIHGVVYLTNVLGTVTNTSPIWSNTVALFTPTNSAGSNYYGYASFDFYVTNLDTSAYFGPQTVSVIVSATPITWNSNMPPSIQFLGSGVSSDPTNYGGSDYWAINVPANAAGVLFEIDNPTGPMAMVVNDGPNLPSLSSYEYSTNQPPPTNTLQIAVLTNSSPVGMHGGVWYMAAVNEAGSNVVYTAKITVLGVLRPPEFLFPANGFTTNINETFPFSITCLATDLDDPPLPLSFALVSGPPGMTNSTSGVLSWTPAEGQGPSTNTVLVSVSNGAYAITNSFTIVVEAWNLPPKLPAIPNQLVIPGTTLIVTNTATNLDIPANPLGYVLNSGVTGNAPVIDANGIISWTPTLEQAGTYLLTTVVTNSDPPAVNATSLTATNSFYVSVLPELEPGQPLTNIPVDAGGFFWLVVPVPTNAIAATNRLLYSTLPVNLWFSTNLPPSITNAADRQLLQNVTSGVSVLTTNVASAPTNIIPGGYYLLGVQNLNDVAVSGAIEIDFALAPPLPDLGTGFPVTNIIPAHSTNWYRVKVPLNAAWATNSLLFATASLNVWYSTNQPPSIAGTGDAELLTNSTGGSRVLSATSTPPLKRGTDYFFGVQNNNDFSVTYVVQVTFGLVPLTIFSVEPTTIGGTNGYLVTWFAPTNYQFHLQWTPVLSPQTWSAFNGVISDAVIAPTNGMFQYFDDGSQSGGFGATRFYRLVLLESPTNTPPFFLNPPLGVFYLSPSNTLTLTNAAKDWDIPAQTLAYFVTNSLAETNVAFTSTGVISWTPTEADLNKTNIVTTIVTDNGVPAASITNTFAIVVSTNHVPPFNSITVVSNGVMFAWTSSASDQFKIRWTTNLAPANWQIFPDIITSTNSSFNFVDTNTPLLLMKFYQLILLP